MKIAINGAGIAGTTLAYWLVQSGHDVILAEQAPALRRGGYLIDFWGGGYDIAEKMGLMPRLKSLSYPVREVRYMDEHGRTRGCFSVDVFRRMTNDRFIDLRRSDLAATIFGAIDGHIETRFGDSIAGCDDLGDRVHVTFDHSAPCDVDFVVGADGLHSRVRHLVFGPDEGRERSLGYHVAAFEVEGYRPRDELVFVNHAAPGRQASRLSMRDDKTLFLFIFRDEYLADRPLSTDAERKAALNGAFADVGWECPRILEAMASVRDIYFDRVSQIHMDGWAAGRTVLLGDAAACVSLLAGEGTGLAMMEAYVLAGELERCDGDHVAAFARYQALMKPFLEKKQQSSVKFAPAFAPRTSLGIWFRDAATRLLQLPVVANSIIGRQLRDDVVLPEYEISGAGERIAGAGRR